MELKNNFIKLDDNKDFKQQLIDIFLQNEHAIVTIDDNSFITYNSFLNYIQSGSNLLISIEELAKLQIGNQNLDIEEWQDTSIDSSRWKFLYSDNDKIINYLRSINPQKIYIMGNLAKQLYNYINVYGNSFESIVVSLSYENYLKMLQEEQVLIIDTNNFSLGLKQEILRKQRLVSNEKCQYFNINELCNQAEIYYFVKTFLNNELYESIVFEFPDYDQFEELTFSEQLRIKSKVNYIYYLSNYTKDAEIKKLLESVMGEDFINNYSECQNLSPGTILKNGICRLADSNNKFCKSINGIRYTAGKNTDYSFDINLFGPCMIYGALVDDEHTISSYLQRIINQYNLDYSVNNYGLRAMELPEQIRIADTVNIKRGDKMIFIVSTNERKLLEKLGYDKVISLLPVFNGGNLKNYFVDKPTHCNHIANSHIAQFIYKKIKDNLLIQDSSNKQIATIIKKVKKRTVLSDNIFMTEYLNYLRQLDISDGPNGAILMNCNPFTLGHYNLVKYASSQVQKLFVFVIQEDIWNFSFEDRFEMVKRGCQEFENVTVIPSGKIFGSSMIFPEYFNREEKTDVSIDVSLDREIFTDYIAPILKIKKRFVGEEKVDMVTAAYNRELKNNLPLYGIEVIEIPRFSDKTGESISAKVVRKALAENDWDTISRLVPSTSLEILSKYSTENNPKSLTKKVQ